MPTPRKVLSDLPFKGLFLAGSRETRRENGNFSRNGVPFVRQKNDRHKEHAPPNGSVCFEGAPVFKGNLNGTPTTRVEANPTQIAKTRCQARRHSPPSIGWGSKSERLNPSAELTFPLKPSAFSTRKAQVFQENTWRNNRHNRHVETAEALSYEARVSFQEPTGETRKKVPLDNCGMIVSWKRVAPVQALAHTAVITAVLN